MQMDHDCLLVIRSFTKIKLYEEILKKCKENENVPISVLKNKIKTLKQDADKLAHELPEFEEKAQILINSASETVSTLTYLANHAKGHWDGVPSIGSI